MQEHRQETQEHRVLPASASPTFGLNPPDSALSADVRLESTLDAACSLIPSEVSPVSVLEIRQEMRGHLQAAIAACEEMELSPEEALCHALAQFGEPEAVARHWRREWKQSQLQLEGRSLPTSRSAVLSGLVSMIALPNVFMAWYYGKADFAHGPMAGCWSYLDCLPWMVHCLPLLFAGGIAGLKIRHRPVSSVFWTTLLTFPATVVAIEAIRMFYNLEPSRSLPEEIKDLISNWTPCYLFLACGACYAGTRLRQRRAKSRRVLA